VQRISEERTRKEMIDPQLEKAGLIDSALYSRGWKEDKQGRMGAPRSTRQALGQACRDLEGLFESLLAEAFS
jgi:hypothetical protein